MPISFEGVLLCGEPDPIWLSSTMNAGRPWEKNIASNVIAV